EAADANVRAISFDPGCDVGEMDQRLPLRVAQFVQPSYRGSLLANTRGDDHVISGSRESDVEQTYALALLARRNRKPLGRLLGRIGKPRRLLRTEGPRPVANPTIPKWIHSVERCAICLGVHFERIPA